VNIFREVITKWLKTSQISRNGVFLTWSQTVSDTALLKHLHSFLVGHTRVNILVE